MLFKFVDARREEGVACGSWESWCCVSETNNASRCRVMDLQDHRTRGDAADCNLRWAGFSQFGTLLVEGLDSGAWNLIFIARTPFRGLFSHEYCLLIRLSLICS
ncbi:hypothetical protein KC19_10G023700 [Ceratodon purpureus]|uniref:Uncharacterized protein n=1 Tax=Ceratodon purpureus TaxID=3225 RepID=A0A8T0GMX2_CERPU|nr:hypothetical protein KC19_10G023700 [Ceratodon purpureus]